jgi:hypothetical protein
MPDVTNYAAGYAACWSDLVGTPECAIIWDRSLPTAKRHMAALMVCYPSEVKLLNGQFITTRPFAWTHPPQPAGRPKRK